jgi:hypothetical protein
MCPIVEAVVEKTTVFEALKRIYTARTLERLTRVVEQEVPRLLALGRSGVCNILWVGRSPSAPSAGDVLVPSGNASIVGGLGTLGGTGERFYREGEGLTGWAWKYGLELHRATRAVVTITGKAPQPVDAGKENCGQSSSWEELDLPPWQWGGKLRSSREPRSVDRREFLALPIVSGNSVVGVVRASRPFAPGRCITQSDVGLLYTFSHHLASVKGLTDAQEAGQRLSFEPIMLDFHEAMKDFHFAQTLVRRVLPGNSDLELLDRRLSASGDWMRVMVSVGHVLTGRYTVGDDVGIEARLDKVRLSPAVPVSLPECVKSAKQYFDQFELDEKRDTLEYTLEDLSKGASVIGHMSSLVVVFREVLWNAIHHNRNERGNVRQNHRVAVVVSPPEDGTITVAFSDAGPSFPPRVADMVSRFSLAEYREVQYDCLGLGVILLLVISHLHGGNVAIRDTSSVPDCTKSIVFSFPVVDTQH